MKCLFAGLLVASLYSATAMADTPMVVPPNAGAGVLVNLNDSRVQTLSSTTHTELDVRNAISNATSGDIFFIEPGSSWTLQGTLQIPEGVSVIGCNLDHTSTNPTFKKNFNGILATTKSWVTLYGIIFDGNHMGSYSGHVEYDYSTNDYTGAGVVVCEGLSGGNPSPRGGGHSSGQREQSWTRVTIRNCVGHGYEYCTWSYYSTYVSCSLESNGGYGLFYDVSRTHFTDNYWIGSHFNSNAKGGIGLAALEKSAGWEGCEFVSNSGPAVDHHQAYDKDKVNATSDIPVPSNEGAEMVSFRSCVFSDNSGPIWLNRYGKSEGILFQDCRIRNNNVNPPPDLPGTIGLIHVDLDGPSTVADGSTLSCEIRGGNSFTGNSSYIFTVLNTTNSPRFILSGGAINGAFSSSNISGANVKLIVRDTAVLHTPSTISVGQGIGIDPLGGTLVSY